MKGEKISVVVPIYNKEKHIKKCLDSIINQSYDNYEVILVDDGSTDNSAQICKEICKQYEFINLYYKKNGGVSSARNLGIEKANGMYIAFIDADDYIDNDYIESLMDIDGDLIVEGYFKDCDDKILEFNIINGEFNKTEILDLLIDKNLTNIFSVPYLKRFNTKIIKENKIWFNENINFGEDFEFVLKYLKVLSGTIVLKNECHYFNRIEKNSLSRKEIPNIWEQLCEIFPTIVSLYSNNSLYFAFYFMRFTKISLLNSYCIKYKNFKKIFVQICSNKYMKNIKFNDFKLFSIDYCIYILIKFKLKLLAFYIFKAKRNKNT